MAEFDPPSFSLGVDLDPPSFSSGLDLDPPPFSCGLNLDPSNVEVPCQVPNSHARSSPTLEDDDELLKLCVSDSDPDVASENPAPSRLKRLRRGTYARSVCPSNNQSSQQLSDKIEDDIEDFSSGDDYGPKDKHTATGHHSVGSSSKTSLCGNRISTRQLPNLSLCKTDKVMFADPNVSPLRRFQLLSSDSDSDDAVRVDFGKNASGNNFIAQSAPSDGFCASASKRSETSTIFPQKDLLRGRFCQVETFHVPAPALDDFCAEYYKTIKDKDATPPVPVSYSSFSRGELRSQTANNGKNKLEEADVENALPPAHQYFFHQDFRIQRLVHNRLPHFFPLSASSDAGHKQQDMSYIDYMSQFSHGEKLGGSRATTQKRSGKGRKKSAEANFEEFSEDFRGWVNPTNLASTPQDAGKRRVHADSQSAGRWYTANGKRVYVTKNGQELTGKGAYKQYRKESGRAFKKKKRKKTAASKK